MVDLLDQLGELADRILRRLVHLRLLMDGVCSNVELVDHVISSGTLTTHVGSTISSRDVVVVRNLSFNLEQLQVVIKSVGHFARLRGRGHVVESRVVVRVVGSVDGKVAAHAMYAGINRSLVLVVVVSIAIIISVIAVVAVVSVFSVVSDDCAFFVRRSLAVGVDVIRG